MQERDVSVQIYVWCREVDQFALINWEHGQLIITSRWRVQIVSFSKLSYIQCICHVAIVVLFSPIPLIIRPESRRLKHSLWDQKINVVPSTSEVIIDHIPSLGQAVDDNKLINLAASHKTGLCFGHHISTICPASTVTTECVLKLWVQWEILWVNFFVYKFDLFP